MSKCDTCVHNDEPWSESPCEKCRVKFEGEPFKMYEARKVTNYDKVRAMSVEELARLCEDGCPPEHKVCPEYDDLEEGARECCRRCWADWLRKEVET